jgi:hypothetical protein
MKFLYFVQLTYANTIFTCEINISILSQLKKNSQIHHWNRTGAQQYIHIYMPIYSKDFNTVEEDRVFTINKLEQMDKQKINLNCLLQSF